jgi:hypothetical protein
MHHAVLVAARTALLSAVGHDLPRAVRVGLRRRRSRVAADGLQVLAG